MSAYYNEHDPKAAAWLRELIKAGLIAPGVVDERSIVDVNPYELTQYNQHHFFAGIGGWSYALRLAGWPDDKPVTTGSPPCQPFSEAGLGLGTKDERHLWPFFYNIITFLNSSTVFGEQVASKAALEWLDGVFADLEGSGYACGSADLCAASVGADHIRQRIFWMAHAQSKRLRRRSDAETGARYSQVKSPRQSVTSGVADTDGGGNAGTENYNPAGNTDSSRKTVALVGWATPTVADSSSTCNATATRHKLPPTGVHAGQTLTDQARISGEPMKSSSVPTGKRGALNPDHSRWLMGYPAEWGSCGAMAMQSCRRSPRSSSKQQSKQE